MDGEKNCSGQQMRENPSHGLSDRVQSIPPTSHTRNTGLIINRLIMHRVKITAALTENATFNLLNIMSSAQASPAGPFPLGNRRRRSCAPLRSQVGLGKKRTRGGARGRSKARGKSIGEVNLVVNRYPPSAENHCNSPGTAKSVYHSRSQVFQSHTDTNPSLQKMCA